MLAAQAARVIRLAGEEKAGVHTDDVLRLRGSARTEFTLVNR